MSTAAQTETVSAPGQEVDAGSRAVAVVFFVSGMPALIYQLLWQRALFTMFGINIEAVTLVVAGFLLGLGFGSLAGGRLSRAPRLDLLATFGAIELTVAAYGVFSLRIITWVGAHSLHLPTVALALVTLALLFVPTLFMGSTLPLLAAYLVRRSHNVGQSVGLLYCVNTVGSATACLLSVVFVMDRFGMQGTVTLAAAINLMVGGSALGEAWRRRGRAPHPAATPVPDALSGAQRRARSELCFAILLAGLLGYVSLSYEIVWFRAFSLASNGSPAFALVLGVYLAGVANGALRVRARFRQPLEQAQCTFLIALSILGASILGFFLLPLAALSAASALGYFWPMLLMIFAQTTLGGMAFPLICHYGVSPDDKAGAGVSLIYLANILGSVAGTLATGFLLMDMLSIAGISALLGMAGVALAGAVAVKGGLPRRRWQPIAAGALIAGLAMPASAGILFDGFYHRLLTNSRLAPGTHFRNTVENRDGVINVDEALNVYGSGMYDGRIAVDLMHDENLLIRPFSLSLFHPDPKQVLMIGLATGAWAQVIANHPQVKHLTIVEINPGYLEIVRQYPVVASLLHDPKVEIVIDDGRRWLSRHPERKFDAIIQNTTWFFRPNVTNLLSEAYLRLTAAHLRDGGVFLYNTTGSLRVQRTGCALFPGVRLINNLVLSTTPITLDPNRLRRTLAAYRINGSPVLDFNRPDERARLDQIVSLLAPPPLGEARPDAAIEDCGGVLARTKGLAKVTDDNMGEEWSHLAIADQPLRRVQQLLGIASKAH
ncbi:MAG: fused MFS/spermidine synthase [Alphaproteobacteria bacterium]|nr:fused MFS/spermidine synthase [Alphaproteobacteria bacterium]